MKLSELIAALMAEQVRAAEYEVATGIRLPDPEVVIVSEYHNGAKLADEREPVLWEWHPEDGDTMGNELWLCVEEDQ